MQICEYLSNSILFTLQGTTTSRQRQEQLLASLEQMRSSSRPSDAEGSISRAHAPTADEAVDEEAEEAAAEMDATEGPSGGDASTEEPTTQAAPRRAIRYSY